jgi:Ser/Thr protein kinase RdoA (MazF antagonist)
MPNFPVTESTLSAAHVGQYLQQQYGLSSGTTCRLFRTGMNHLYIVADDRVRFVFRIYTRDWRTALEIKEEIRLLNHLNANGISVSHPIADTNNQYIQNFDAPEGQRFGVLFSFAPGKKFSSLSADACFNVGVAMASMHRATLNFKLERIQYSPETLLIRPLGIIKSFFNQSLDEIKFIERTVAYLVDLYNSADSSEIRKGALHLDIWFDNMHLDDNQQITIFDFDFCGNGWLCHDIAYFMLQLFNTNPTAADYETKLTKFLDGYESITRITDEEKRIIPFVSISIWFFYLSIQCDRFDTWSNIFLNEDHLKRFIGMIKKWIAYNKIESF